VVYILPFHFHNSEQHCQQLGGSLDVVTLALDEGGQWGYLHHQIPSAFSYRLRRSQGKAAIEICSAYDRGLCWKLFLSLRKERVLHGDG